MEQLTKFSDIDKVDVDEKTRTVTLTGSLDDYYYYVQANGTTSQYRAPDGNGEQKNSWTVQNPVGKETLNEVDGNGIANNQPVYGKNLSLSYNMSNVKDPIDVANLRRNSLNIYISGANPERAQIPYADIFSQTTGTISKTEFINTVIDRLEKTPPLDGANTTIKYTFPNLEISTSLPASASSSTRCYAYISESTEGRQEDTTKPSWKTNSLAFTTSTTPPSAEVGGTFTVKIPDVSSFKVPFSFQLGFDHPDKNGWNDHVQHGILYEYS